MLPIVSAVLAAVGPTIAKRVVDRVLPGQPPEPGAVAQLPPARPVDLQAIAREVAEDPEIRRVAEAAAQSVAKPWWASKTIHAGIGVVLMSVGTIVGLAITSEDASAITDNLDKVAQGLLGLYVIYGRIVARSPLK